MPDEPVALDHGSELLLRQVHPSFLRDGRPSGQAFRPSPKDAGELSVSRGSLTTPAAAHEHFTQRLRLRSAGTWAVTVDEVKAQGLQAISKPTSETAERPADPAHAFIDFRSVPSKGKAEAKGSLLARTAAERGRLHPPP